MMRLHVLIVVLVLVLFAGCATGISAPTPRASQSPRARCLSDPNEAGTRPLLFLFCMESP
jgi:hypothetical protein